jgi:hypothetical protein
MQSVVVGADMIESRDETQVFHRTNASVAREAPAVDTIAPPPSALDTAQRQHMDRRCFDLTGEVPIRKNKKRRAMDVDRSDFRSRPAMATSIFTLRPARNVTCRTMWITMKNR